MKYKINIRVERWKHPDWKSHLLGILQGWAEIADGLVTLLSFGFLMSNFEMQVASFRTKIYFETLKRKLNEPFI